MTAPVPGARRNGQSWIIAMGEPRRFFRARWIARVSPTRRGRHWELLETTGHGAYLRGPWYLPNSWSLYGQIRKLVGDPL